MSVRYKGEDMRKLKRDIVVSEGKVGVFYADTDGSKILLECSPEHANKLVEAWNKEAEARKEMSDTEYVMELLSAFKGIREELIRIVEAIKDTAKT